MKKKNVFILVNNEEEADALKEMIKITVGDWFIFTIYLHNIVKIPDGYNFYILHLSQVYYEREILRLKEKNPLIYIYAKTEYLPDCLKKIVDDFGDEYSSLCKFFESLKMKGGIK
ncbi:hypothetical protein KAI65_03570 [Candidatus Parcubacteria bacterium]|nr:hypothetical protein [Candidatus Parcubacteria bacterium]